MYSSTTLSKRQVAQLARAFVFDRRGSDTIPRAPDEFLGCAQSKKEGVKCVRQQAKHKPRPLTGLSNAVLTKSHFAVEFFVAAGLCHPKRSPVKPL
jgi:hypothetical protein